MKWIEFANELQKIVDGLTASGRFPEFDKEIIESRTHIERIQELPKEQQETIISKFKTKRIKEMFVKLQKGL